MAYIKGFEDKYPEEIIGNRINVEGSVIGTISKDLLILDDSSLEVKDFKTEEGRLYFKILRDIRKNGFNTLDEVTVMSNISGELLDKFEEYGGYESLNNLSEIVDLKNTESILDSLHRENIIIKLFDKGFDMLKPQLDDKGKEYIPIKRFRKMKSEDIISFYEVELNKYAVGYSTKILEECRLVISDDYIEKVLSGELSGIPFGEVSIDVNGNMETVYPYLSRDINGIIRGSTTILGAYSSVGKTSYWTGLLISLIEQGEKVLIFSNEQDRNVFETNFIVWICYKHFRYFDVNKKTLKNGNLKDKDLKVLKEAIEYYNKHYANSIEFIHLPDMDMSTIKSKTRYYSLKEGYSVVLIDTLKQDYTDGTADATYHKLIQDTRTIDALAKRYELIALCSFQLAPSTLGKLFLDVTCLSGAKAVKDILENLFLMRIVYDEELIPTSKLYCKPFQYKKNGDSWTQEEFKTDQKKIYRMLFTDKCRSGVMSGDNGIAQLLEFDALHSVFKEVAYCKPKRGVIS